MMIDQGILERIDSSAGDTAEAAVVKGTRLSVDYICKRVARGATAARLLREHPELVKEDIVACLFFPQKIGGHGVAQPAAFALGHLGDDDATLILQALRLTPEERLDRHERWRLFIKEVRANARLRQASDSEAGRRTG